MEAVGRIKEASLDINTIGLYDADMERERIENGIRSVSFKAGIERGLEQGNVEKQTSIISTMLGNGISQEEISRMTGIPIKEVKVIRVN
ncbi:MAG: hypothetical protein PUB03_02800 [bacterium]|nr:hypothetical protein [bacterium]